MNNIARVAFFSFLLYWQCEIDARELLRDSASCRAQTSRLGDLRVTEKPRRVLLVPLLRKGRGSNENELWPEQPSAKIEVFYRSKFKAEVVWLRGVRVWQDYYKQVDRLLRQSALFDRVIFIGHGSFNGPSLNYEILRKNFKVEGSKGTLYRAIDAQPGILRELTITYDLSRNPAFDDYIASQ